MKKNAKQNLALVAAAVILINFSSCGKYEEGPGISLRSKTARLVNEWEVSDVEADDDTGDYLDDLDITFEFEKGGDFSMTMQGEFSYYGYTFQIDDESDGEWEWEDGKESVIVDIEDADEETEFEILRLTNKELKFEDEDGNIFECDAAE